MMIVEIDSVSISDKTDKRHEEEKIKDDVNDYLRNVVTCLHTYTYTHIQCK